MTEEPAAYPRSSRERVKPKFSIINVMGLTCFLFLLFAILWPSGNGTKAIAKKTMCMSNLKQMGMASILYASDNNEEMPLTKGLATVGEAATVNLPPYEDLIQPYLKAGKDRLVFQCPEDFRLEESPMKGKSWFEAYGSSYQFHPVASRLKPFGGTEGADKAVFIHEADVFHKIKDLLRMRNVAYYDGHAKFIREDEMFKEPRKK